MDFLEQVRKELEGLTEKQQREFVWRCAVRALPFLGSNGHFDYWTKEYRQKHLFSVFNALDISNSAAACSIAAVSAPDEYHAVNTVVDANVVFTNAANAAAAAAVGAAAVFATAAANAATYSIKVAASYALLPAYHASKDAAYDAAYTAACTAEIKNMGFESKILDDLKKIKTNKKPLLSTSTYGIVWDNFQQALKNEGCEYWAKLYKGIFENNFEMDREELERRINVPESIKVQGAAAVSKYMEELAKGAKRLNEARIIILGEKGSGKTCLARKLKDPNAAMTTPEESTPGVDTSLWKLEKENINVRIWDFAGHTVTHAVHQFFLSERCLYIIVYDGRTEVRNRLEYWLDHMMNFGGDSEAIILVNERDEHKIEIPINILKEKYRIAGLHFFDIGADTDKLLEFREEVAMYIKNNPSWEKQQIPESYYAVKEDLEDLFKKKEKQQGTEHITKTEFLEIASKNQANDPEELLRALHSLGVSLWYKDMEKYDTLVLNPEWISEGVYKVINWVNNEKRHDITLECFEKVFHDADQQRFPKNKHEFLFDLIKHYELAYETAEGKGLIIPHLLNQDQPSSLPVFEPETSLKMKYEADRPLPPNTISRFIVRHNEQIKKEQGNYLIWKTGVILEDGKGSTALVREVDRTISVSVKGIEKTNFISMIRETLNNIFESYKSQRPELSYKVIDETQTRRQELWLPEPEIATLSKKDIPYYDWRTDARIPMKPTIINYNITETHYHVTMSGGEIGAIGGAGQIGDINTFNFQNCNIELQGNLNDLARRLEKQGNKEDAEELKETAEILKEVKDITDKEEIREKGIAQRLKRIVEGMGDEKSRLHKTVKGIGKGISIAQDIAKEYNKIAQWLALPQVPTPFLKKE
ncbi:MAG: hypothetical protein IH597_07500 [Bacteroidales bacterium]|nr:hypothetical protein [Bacteroidales bacterium]